MDALPPPSQAVTKDLAAAYTSIRTSVLVEAAQKLGISLDQLRSELHAGRPLSDIAAVAGVALAGTDPSPPPPVVVPSPSPPGSQVDVRL